MTPRFEPGPVVVTVFLLALRVSSPLEAADTPNGVASIETATTATPIVDVAGTLRAHSILFPDGSLQSTAAAPATTTVVVSPVPFDPVASGQRLRNALAAILDASASRRYLLRLEPGIYDIRSATEGDSLVMKPWVSLEGSGETVTEVRGGGFPSNVEGTIETADNSELRRLSVRNTGGDAVAIAILVVSDSSALDHVTAIASGATVLNYGVRHTGAGSALRLFDVRAEASGGTTAYGMTARDIERATIERVQLRASGASDNVGLLILNELGFDMTLVLDSVVASAEGPGSCVAARVSGGANVQIRRSRLVASGGAQNRGVEILGTSPTEVAVLDSTVVAEGALSYGIYNETPSDVEVDHSRVGGETASLFELSGGVGGFLVGATRLSGGAVVGVAKCAYVYDQGYDPLADDCGPVSP